MRRVAITIMMLIVLGVASVAQAVPIAYLDASEPGLGVNFDNGTSDLMAWGAKNYWSDGSWPGESGYPQWDYTGGKAVVNVESSIGGYSYGRLLTTLKDEDVGAYPSLGTWMTTDKDWIFSMLWTNVISMDAPSKVFESMAWWGSSANIARFYGTGDNNFTLEGGDGGDINYAEVWSGSLSTGVERKLTLHYKSATSLLDFYIDDTLVAENFRGCKGKYTLYKLQIGSIYTSGEIIDDIIIGVLPRPGDVNGDGLVGMGDATTIIRNQGMIGGASWPDGDLNGDGNVDIDDYNLVQANWGNTDAPEPPESTATPEPSTLLVLAAAALAGLITRSRHGLNRALTILALVALLGAASPAMAVLTYSLQPVAGPTGITDYSRSYDIVATTDNNGGTNPPGGLAVQDMILQMTSGAGSIYQDAFGADIGPPSQAQIDLVPSVEFDTYVTLPVDFGISGYAVDLGSSGPQTFSDQLLDISWSPSGGSHTGPGSFTIARITVVDWAAGTYTIGGFEEAEPPGAMTPQWGTNLVVSIEPLPMSLRVAEVVDPSTPTGYRAYDFFAKINSNMGGMELLLSTTNPDIS